MEEQAKEAVKKELKRKIKNININVGLFTTEQNTPKQEVPKSQNDTNLSN